MVTTRFTTETDRLERKPTFLVKLTVDRCSLTYTQAPCTAIDKGDGNRCFYSFPTCQDRPNYAKTTADFYFSMREGPRVLDGEIQVYPYIKSLPFMGQEIQPRRNITVNERMQITFHDEPNPNIFDLDKNASFRNTADGGTFWRQFFQIYRNFVGRPCVIYKGYQTDAYTLADYDPIFTFHMSNVVWNPDGSCTLEVTDILKKLDKKIPNEISSDNTLQTAMNDSDTSSVVSVPRAAEWTDLASQVAKVYIRIGTEDMEVTTRNTTTNQLTLLRAQFGTTKATHAVDDKIIEIVPYTSADGADGLALDTINLDILDRCNVPSANILTSSFNDEVAIWYPSDRFQRIITKPTAGKDLLNELKAQTLTVIWVNEDQKAEFKVIAPPLPGQTLNKIRDTEEIINGSIVANLNDEMRVSRCSVYFDLIAGKDGNKPEDFNEELVRIAADEETDDFYGEQKERVIYSKWFMPGVDGRTMAAAISGRILSRFSTPPVLVGFATEHKDYDLKVGDLFKLSTARVQDAGPTSIVDRIFFCLKKKPTFSTYQFRSMDAVFTKRYCFIGPNSLPAAYDSATDAQKEYCWIGDGNNQVGADKEEGYYVF